MNEKSRIEYLREKALALPLCPGVYLMKDRGGRIIYVGKSRALKNRVSSYFTDLDGHTVKTLAMINRVYDFDVMLTDTEIEALALENRLIKLHVPRFNIKLKDGKNYPYIRLSAGDEYPRLSVERMRKSDGSRYFGPYSGTAVAYSILNTARKAFGIPDCKKIFPRDIPSKPCLNFQMKYCCGLCTGNVSPEEYSKRFEDVSSFLRGNLGRVRKNLREKMEAASENLLFEAAADYRDGIKKLERLWDGQKVVGSPDNEYDLFSSFADGSGTCVVIFIVREGALLDRRFFVFAPDRIFDGDAFQSLLYDVYAARDYIPPEIIFDNSLPKPEKELICGFLKKKAGRNVEIRIPKQGNLRKLCNMAVENCREELRKQTEAAGRSFTSLVHLAKLLLLEEVPESIEAYDISNFGNENITGGRISFKEGKFDKRFYRTYSISSTDTQDDYAAMSEMLRRRLSHPEDELPDLILLDGGKGHVSVVKDVMRALDVQIPVFGMVKDDFHKTRALTDGKDEINIASERDVFMMIYRIQEEVHRFTVSKMSAAKRKAVRRSVLDDIKGIGPAKSKAILHTFGGLAAVKNATVEELE
ncbi:MAG: excinuclease ABC subunit UvrC, partial [Clostridia bacterium]|nr:excinuclease ABC subunit UvrC [Clostridia bacterium]